MEIAPFVPADDSVSVASRLAPDEAAIARIDALAERGLFLQAWTQASAYAPLAEWRGTEGRLSASRLASHLGAPALSLRIDARAVREAPSDPRAVASYAHTILQRRGPFAAWLFLEGRRVDAPPGSRARAELLHAKAHVAVSLRDIESAESWLREAEGCEVRPAPHEFLRALVCEAEDRIEDALAVARAALAKGPASRWAIQQTAQYLVLLDRRDEALEVLDEGARASESGYVLLQLAALEQSMRLHDRAERSLERHLALSPLLEPSIARARDGMLAEIAYARGDVARAIALLRRVPGALPKRLADRMQNAPEGARRVELDVPFVRQDRLTCVPATLTAVSRHWGMPADHLAVADAICYDGTPAHSERAWAESNGWLAGEFTVTWASGRALLDRGVPFVVTTAFASEGHAQAIVGYDERRGTFRVRDPARPDLPEMDVEAFLEAFRSSGPRGMWLVPKAEAARLEGLSLPDAELWDRLYGAQRALDGHQGEAARELYESLEREAPGHRITLSVRRQLAAYDRNAQELRAAAEALLSLYPDDARAELDALASMESLATKAERIARLEATVSRGKSEPIFAENLGAELHADARENDRAARLLRRAIRARAHRARPIFLLAKIAWAQCRFDEALALHRFATCLEDTREEYGRAYFTASRAMGQTERALAWLRTRAQRLGRRSSLPAQTLHWALGVVDRPGEADAILEGVLEQRPNDGPLLLYAAGVHASRGRSDVASRLLARAEGHVPEAQWAKAAAELAHVAGDPARRVERLRRALELEPLAVDAHAALAEALAELEGPGAAIAHVERAVDRFPHNQALLRLLVHCQTAAGPEARERAARRALGADANDAWALRELALALAGLGRFQEALEVCDRVQAIEPADLRTHLTRGQVLTNAGRTQAARAAWLDAFLISADCVLAIKELLDGAADPASRAANLQGVGEGIVARAVDGSGIAAWAERAHVDLAPEDALARVAWMRGARPDLWPAWVAHVENLRSAGWLDEARALARDATDRFPLVAPVWTARADAAAEAGDGGEEVRSLEQATAVAPLDPSPAYRLAAALQRAGDTARARAVLERVVAASPSLVEPALALAQLEWVAGLRDAAVERVARAAALAPDSMPAWGELYDKLSALGRRGEALAKLRAAAAARPWSTATARCLARVARAAGERDEALAACDRAIAIDPRDTDAHDLRAVLLVDAGKIDEALRECRPAVFGDDVPQELRGRAAWIKMQRGDATGAQEELRALVARDARYAWAWAQLVEVAVKRGDVAARTEAAAALVKASPSAHAYATLADARLASGDRAGAQACWQRAAVLGDDALPAIRLARAALDAGDLEQAARWTALIRARAGEGALASEIRVALRRGDRAAAVDLMRRACDASAGLLALCRRLLVYAGLGEEAYRVLGERAAAPSAPLPVVSMWALTSVEREDGRVEPWLLRADPSSATTRAVAASVLALLDRRGKAKRARWLVKRLPRELREAGEVRAAMAKVNAAGAPARKRIAARVTTGVLLVVFAACVITAVAHGASVDGNALVPLAGPVAILVVRMLSQRARRRG